MNQLEWERMEDMIDLKRMIRDCIRENTKDLNALAHIIFVRVMESDMVDECYHKQWEEMKKCWVSK